MENDIKFIVLLVLEVREFCINIIFLSRKMVCVIIIGLIIVSSYSKK
jgi:hypothetical protein